MPTNFSYAMSYGAEVQDRAVRFRLWAPAQTALTLVLETADGEHSLPMQRADAGWFELTTDAARPGSRYCYALEDGLRVPDPASRFQPDDVHEASQVVDPNDYDWHRGDWRGRPWRDAVVYETHVGAFTREGSYDGVRRKLDYLADLGVTAVELMPLADFDGRRNWGYDGVLSFAPDASYGEPAALKRLIDAAHERGLMMLLDVVYNHFGPSGNYLARYAPAFFTDRYQTPWGDAIDFTRREVREFFIHNALYWLEEYRFDGLRLDAVDQIHDASPVHFLTELAQTVRARIRGRHVHLVLENDDNAAHYLERREESPSNSPFQASPAKGRARIESRQSLTLPLGRAAAKGEWEGDSFCPSPSLYTAQWNDDFHHAAHVLATGEEGGYYADYRKAPAAAFGRALAEGFIYQGEHSAYRDRERGEASADLPSLAFVDFLQNHDQIGNRAFGERLGALAGAEAVETLTAILLLAPQPPLLFMGEEWGAPQPFYYFCDYAGELAAAVRDGRRREFARFPAFADPAARERIPDPNARATFAASRLRWRHATRPDGKRRLKLCRELLAVRHREVVPHLPAVAGAYEVERGALRVSWRLADGGRLHLAANPAADAIEGLDWYLPGESLYAQPDPVRPGPLNVLPPWAVLWTRESLGND